MAGGTLVPAFGRVKVLEGTLGNMLVAVDVGIGAFLFCALP
jgi:hypothetical protein